MTNEIWLPIPGTNGAYMASSYGRIMSVERTVSKSNGRTQTMPTRILSPSSDNSGYLQVNVCPNRKGAKVHTLVCEAFHGVKLDGYIVDHISRVITDNTLENLRWVTYSQNGNNNGNKGNTMRHLHKPKNAIRYSIAKCVDKKTYHYGSYPLDEAREIRDRLEHLGWPHPKEFKLNSSFLKA